MKSQLDDRYLVRIAVEHPILTWLCEHAAYLLNRLEVGHDGKTAYVRMKGKRATVLGIEFGETIMWKQKPVGVSRKLETQWQFGVFIGVRRSSGELVVADQLHGVKCARTIRRVPLQSRWVVGYLEWVKFTPWNLGASDPLAEGEQSRFDVKAGPGARMSEDERAQVLLREPVTHRTHRFKKDFEQFGYTNRCPGCSSLLRDIHPQPHSEACRLRMDLIMRNHARDASAKHLQESRKRSIADDSVKANAGTRNDMLDREDMAIDNNDQMELEELAEWHLAAKEKRRLKTDAEGSGASSSRNVNVLQNETQSQMVEIPQGPGDQRERERAAKCWKPSLRILRAEVPDQVPRALRTGGPADGSVGCR